MKKLTGIILIGATLALLPMAVQGAATAATKGVFTDTNGLVLSHTNLLIKGGLFVGTNATAFGDSFTSGGGASVSNNCYVARLASMLGWSITNLGVAASEACDIALSNVYPLTVTAGERYLITIGFNDARQYGSDATGLGTFKRSLTASLVWLGIPTTSRLAAQDAKVVKSGTWANSTAIAGVLAKKTSEENAYAAANLYGRSIYVGYNCRKGLDDGATFSIGVDNALVYSGDSNVGTTSGNYAPTFWPEVVRVSGLTEGLHYVTVTNTSAGGTKYLELNFMAGSSAAAVDNGPVIFLGDNCRMNSTGYAYGDPTWDHATDAIMQQYNDIKRNIASALAGDGLRILSVDLNSYYNPDEGEIAEDDVHPNDTGHLHIAQAFAAAINAVGPKPGALFAERLARVMSVDGANIGFGTNVAGGKIGALGDANAWTGYLKSSAKAGQGLGLLIDAGTSAADYSLFVRNQAGTEDYLIIKGDGTTMLPQLTAGPVLVGDGGVVLTTNAVTTNIVIPDNGSTNWTFAITNGLIMGITHEP